MTFYESNYRQLDFAINNLEPFFRAEFCNQIGDEVTKVINKNQHPTAHIIIKDQNGVKAGRVTTAISYEFAEYDEINKVAVFDYFLKLCVTEDRYKIIDSVDYLFTYYNTQTELDSNKTIVMMLDSRKIAEYLNKFTGGGNAALLKAGLPVISGFVGLPLSLLQDIHAIVNFYTIDWNSYTYTNLNGLVKPLLSHSIKRAWSFYSLAMSPPKKSVVSFCMDTKQYKTYESVTEAAIEVMVENLNETTLGKKKLASSISCVSNCINGKQRKVMGKDGYWYTFFLYDELKKLEANDSIKEEVLARFKKQTRVRKSLSVK